MERHDVGLSTPGKTNQSDMHGSSVPTNNENMGSEPHDFKISTSPGIMETPTLNPAELNSLEWEQDDEITEDDDNHTENAQKQLVLYDPAVAGAGAIEPFHPVGSQPMRNRRNSFPNYTSRVLPSVGAFTVQCAKCFKWRLIPTKEKYEAIREHILEQPFYCETAREWRPEVSCDDEPDITQDGSRLWAIDKPSIAQPPSGWERLLRIRGEGGTKFADVYYTSPSGKRLRSMVEVQRHLEEHPQYVEQGVRMSQFSFQIPRPLQEDYVKKRRAAPRDENGAADVDPISWAGPVGNTNIHLGGQGPAAPFDTSPLPESQSPKRRRMDTI